MRLAVAVFALLLSGCVSTAAVTLERYRGVYSTHFDGIPDQTGICAVIRNPGPRPVAWVRLKLKSFSQLGEVPGQWTSHWLYERALAPGEAVAVEFEHPPSADQIELAVAGYGEGDPPRRGRPLRRARACSEARLQAELKRAREDRSMAGVQLLPILRRNDPARELELAQGPP